MTFDFATAGRILFGSGVVSQLAGHARSMGGRALVVTGASPERATALVAGLDCVFFAVPGEPAVDTIRTGVEAARNAG